MVKARTIAERLEVVEARWAECRAREQNATFAMGPKYREATDRALDEVVKVKNAAAAEIELAVALYDLSTAQANNSRGTEHIEKARTLVAELNGVDVYPAVPTEVSD